MGTQIALEHGLRSGVLGGLTSGLFFGGSFALLLGLSQVFGSSKGGIQASDTDMTQERTLVIMGERDEVVREVRHAFETLGVRRVDIDDPQGGVLTGHTSAGLRSWGEHLTAVVKPRGGVCEVTLSSRPRLPTTLVDSGKNMQNLDAIEQRLLKKLPTPMAEPAKRSPQARAQHRAKHVGRTQKH
jgi:hypothetical protein